MAMAPRRAGRALVLCCGLTFVFAASAASQTALEDSVMARSRPDFSPFGLELDEVVSRIGLLDRKTVEDKSSPLSSFVVFPKLQVSPRYETNIFREQSNPQADSILVVEPSLRIASDWANHALAFTAGGELAKYQTHQTEDYQDFGLALSGRIDMTETLRGNASLSYAEGHEGRGSRDEPTATIALGQIKFNRQALALSGLYDIDVISMRLHVHANRLDYQDLDGLDFDIRDRTVYGAAWRTGYSFVPGTAVFIEPGATLVRYEQEVDAQGRKQGSFSYGLLFGMTWDVTSVTFFEGGAGVLVRQFDEPTSKEVMTSNFAAKLIWNPTDVITVTGNLGRSFGESQLENETSVLQTTARAQIDFEVLENMTLSVNLGYLTEDSEGAGAGRNDTTLDGGLVVHYLLNRNWYADLALGHSRRDSNAAGAGYSNSAVSARIGVQL